MPGFFSCALFASWLRFFIVFCAIFQVDAFQGPFARLQVLRAADSSDCYFGSGETGKYAEFRDLHSIEDPLQFHPWGEALNPGPSDADPLLWIGFSNPTGLRNKEEIALSLGCGIFSFCETQLSSVTQKSCAKRLKFLAANQHRQLRTIMGAPIAFRPGSSWAGGWAGVATIADFPSRELHLPYQGEHECGRILSTSHYVAGLTITNVTVYGYPAGPTWPKHKDLTTTLLQTVTTEIILGGNGVRVIGGDFNVCSTELALFHYWRQLGWCSAQDFAERMWDQPPVYTCKNATERDMIWMSPEAQAICREVDVSDFFMEHATISIGLQCLMRIPSSLAWPLPSRIPWALVDETWTEQACIPEWNVTGTSEQQWAQLGATLELSLQGHIPGAPHDSLTRAQRGRLQRTKPLTSTPVPTLLKASRPSEVQMRNDLIGSETKSWLRQLRRLQSYRAAIHGGKTSADAIHYRLLLWSSIRQAHGFCGGFAHWWATHRLHSVPGVPCILPSAPPDAATADLLFENFKICYEKFEQWHLRQRSKLLASKYDAGMTGLFQDLKAPGRDRLDLLTQQTEAGILAVSEDRLQLHLDAALVPDLFHPLEVAGSRLHPAVIAEDLLTLKTPCTCEPGDLVIQRQIVSDIDAIHSQLLDFWKPKWCQMAEVSAADWDRIIAFNQNYLPKLTFEATPITVSQWLKVLRRFKPTAARGVDGISHEDLLRMPLGWTQRLLDLLNQIEDNQSAWPAQILFGVVSVLAKCADAMEMGQYRPVVVFSIVYRAWASLRARQMLRHLAPYLDSTLYGFAPHCETSQLWMSIQGEVESSLQDGMDFCGLSTDLVKAFNYIPRKHSFALAEHLGMPPKILHPWRSFLEQCTRSFSIRNCLSDSTTSTSGVPEGDAMSVYAMVQISFAFHRYMKMLRPSVAAYSYVDNLTLTAHHPFLLSLGFSGLVEFFRLWNLKVDLAKSYCWTPCSKFKRLMSLLGMKRVDSAAELGGALSFTRRKFTGVSLERIAKLDGTWQRLKTSRAPMCQKLPSLHLKFWPAALYASHAIGLGENHIDKLRTRALKALKLNKAGVNSRLRLSLTANPSMDPGFWRLRQAFFAFRRMMQKEPQFGNLWQLFLSRFDGKFFSGPFSQLLSLGNQIQWSFSQLTFLDHDGLEHSLRWVDDNALDALLLDGWFQHVSTLVTHRRTMSDLSGLDTLILQSKLKTLNALDSSLVSSLLSGAFMSTASHSRYDLTKQADCSICRCPDSQEHWLDCPRFAAVRGSIEGWVDRHPHDSTALRVHLLPSRSPFWTLWKQALAEVPDTCECFESLPGNGDQHLFSDGTVAGVAPYKYAGWGCLNSSTGKIVSAGFVPGQTQTSDRAELYAALAAIQWTRQHDVTTHLWMDAKFVATGIEWVLQHGDAGPWTNKDLWSRIVDNLAQMRDGQIVPHWNPSHLDEKEMESPFEDWFRYWNNQVDTIASHYNLQRSVQFTGVQLQAMTHHTMISQRWDQLKQFYCKVAALTSTEMTSEGCEPGGIDETLPHFDFADDDHPSVEDLYSHDWGSHLQDIGWTHPTLPGEFVGSIFEWLQGHSCVDARVYPLSFVELSFLLIRTPGFRFPFFVPSSGGMEMIPLCHRLERPTLASILRLVRDAVVSLVRCCDHFDVMFRNGNKVGLGMHTPVAGIYVKLTTQTLQRGHHAVQEFTSSRRIRRSCDLARPI